MPDRSRRSRRRPSKKSSRRAARDDYDPPYDEEDLSDTWDDDTDRDDDFDEEEERPSRRRGGAARRSRPPGGRKKRAPAREERSGRSRRSARAGGGGGRFDWDAAEEDEDFGSDGYDDDYEDDRESSRTSRRTIRRRGRKSSERKKKGLMDLCTPVFGYAALLPRQAGGPQPGFEQFRHEVVQSIKAVEEEAAGRGVAKEDAAEASFAMAMFIDEEVASSEWEGKARWSAEPLHITMHGDPEGGVNFFKRLERLSDRQKEVRAVYLVCLALGFRGKFIELDATQQVTKIAQVKENTIRGIFRVPMERRDMLFPEAYRPASSIEDEVPRPPRWWLIASLSALAVTLVLYIVLWFAAGRQPSQATTSLETLSGGGAPHATTGPDAATAEDEPTGGSR